MDQPDQPSLNLSENNQSLPVKKKINWLFVILVAIVSISATSLILVYEKDLSLEESLVTLVVPTHQAIISPSPSYNIHQPIIIYIDNIKYTDTSSRSWPTVRIWQKIGDAEPEFLAEVGKVGEYPNSYLLSPDHKYLLINLETKLQMLNLETKELKDLFIPKRQVLSVSYSPDLKQLFIWDQKYAPTDGNYNYYIRLFDFATQQDQILKEGTSSNPFFSKIWRTDNKLILQQARGGAPPIPYYFDLASNLIIKTPGNFSSGLVSKSGGAMAAIKDTIADVCNDYSGSGFSVYNIIDPISANILGTIGGEGYIVSPLVFSPDDKELLYEAYKPWANRNDCNKKAQVNYFKVNIVTGQVEKLSDPTTVLKSWNEDYVGATTDYDSNKAIWSILIGDQIIITSDKSLQIAGQFYN